MLSQVTGVVVHSHWGRRIIEAELSGVPVRRIGLAVADPGSPDGRQLRAGLGVDPESVLLMHLGFLTREKGMEIVLTALAAACDIGVRAHLVMVGEGDEQSKLGSAARALGYGDLVSLTGWVTAEELRQLPAAADLGVVLRTPSAGETSAAALRFLACGTPVAVTGVRQFLEWPEAAAPRITPGPSSAADLARLIAEAGDGDGAWSERRGAARAAYAAEHRPQDVADQLVEAIEDITG
jgi:glycosyltransferase involved in cell wall biosynthesis